MEGDADRSSSRTYGPVHLTLLGWVSMLGTDILLHAGILARAYDHSSPFLLPPERAFALIPLGYLSFLILAGLLVWLSLRLGVGGVRPGARLGLLLGSTVWGSLVLGLASISTAPVGLLVGWFVGQSIEMGIAGGVVGAARAGSPPRRLWLLVAGWVVLALVVVTALQSTGLAPVTELR